MLCGLMLSSCAKQLTFLILIGYFQFAYYDLPQEKQTLKVNLPNDEMGNQFVVSYGMEVIWFLIHQPHL